MDKKLKAWAIAYVSSLLLAAGGLGTLMLSSPDDISKLFGHAVAITVSVTVTTCIMFVQRLVYVYR